MSEIREHFKTIQSGALIEKTSDVYASSWSRPKYDRTSSDYGRPKKGTLTELRAKKAGESRVAMRGMGRICSKSHRSRNGASM